MNPFQQFNEYLLIRALKKAHIPEANWVNFQRAYQTIENEFDPAVIDVVEDEYFIQTTNTFFDFKKACTIESRRTVFKKWLKNNWKYFKARNFDEVCQNIFSALNAYNSENDLLIYINWISCYGGLLREPPAKPDKLEIDYKKDKKFVYPVPPLYHNPDQD
jgi:hypothetical protein